MGKTIRPTYPMEFSIGILLLIFVLSLFLSHQIFEVSGNSERNLYIPAVLVSSAVIIMLLVLWEEFLFPVHIKAEAGGFVFRNHRSKLRKQLLIYLVIPVIFVFLYMEYEVNLIRFIAWAAVCIIAPVAGKLISGIKNYNDFLKLSPASIEYKNNEKEGRFELTTLQQILLIKDERNILHKVQLVLKDNTNVTIDLDEMEIEDFYNSINSFITTHYKTLVKDSAVV